MSSSACTQRPPASAFQSRPPWIKLVPADREDRDRTHIVVLGIILLIIVLVIVIILIIVVVIELIEVILIKLLEGKSFTSEPVDCTRDKLLFDVLAELVVKLEALLNVGSGVIILLSGGLGRREEVEERLGGDSLLDDTGLLGVYRCWSANGAQWVGSLQSYSCCAASSARYEQ